MPPPKESSARAPSAIYGAIKTAGHSTVNPSRAAITRCGRPCKKAPPQPAVKKATAVTLSWPWRCVALVFLWLAALPVLYLAFYAICVPILPLACVVHWFHLLSSPASAKPAEPTVVAVAAEQTAVSYLDSLKMKKPKRRQKAAKPKPVSSVPSLRSCFLFAALPVRAAVWSVLYLLIAILVLVQLLLAASVEWERRLRTVSKAPPMDLGKPPLPPRRRASAAGGARPAATPLGPEAGSTSPTDSWVIDIPGGLTTIPSMDSLSSCSSTSSSSCSDASSLCPSISPCYSTSSSLSDWADSEYALVSSVQHADAAIDPAARDCSAPAYAAPASACQAAEPLMHAAAALPLAQRRSRGRSLLAVALPLAHLGGSSEECSAALASPTLVRAVDMCLISAVVQQALFGDDDDDEL